MTAHQTLATPALQTARHITWKLDPAHSRADFSVRHLMVSNVRGSIPVRGGIIVQDLDDITKTRMEAELDVAGVHTGVADRDAHLRSPDFFDVATYPTWMFVSTRIEPVGDAYRVHGSLTIRDVTREVVLDVELTGEGRDPWGGTRAGAIARTTFDRRDFGLGWNAALETGGVLVGDKIKVELDLQAIRQ